MRPVGDADGNHTVNVSDITRTIDFVFASGTASYPKAAMDATCEEMINVSDIIYLIQYVFGDGPPPCE
jgi:hypothetical protein